MTNAEILLDVLGDINEQHIEEIDKRISFVKKRRVVSFISIAAVFVILCTSVIPLFRLNPATTNPDLQGVKNKNYTNIDNNLTFGGHPKQNPEFIYYIDSDGNITCLDTETDQTTILLSDKNYANYDIYSDGKHLYLSTGSVGSSDNKTNTPPVCYEIVKDKNGKPCELKLIDDNIVK